MTALEHILCATDFSLGATRAAQRAARLAHGHHATLHLVHVMDNLLLQMFAGSIDEHPLATEQRLLDSARTRLKELAELLAKRFNVPVHDEVLVGRTHKQVALYAAAHAVDLSVFGAHGQNFLREVFVGSTVAKFLHKGQQPTLVVRGDDEQFYRALLVAVDFSPTSRLALEAAARIAPQASIHVLHVSDVPFEDKLRYAGVDEAEISRYRNLSEQQAWRALDALLDGVEGASKMTRSVVTGSPAQTIIDRAQAQHADLVVMGKRGQFELDEFLLGSVSKRVLEEIDRDLLLVAPEAAR